MPDKTKAGPAPEGEALPVVQRALEAIEHWYAKHFHAAAVAGRTPLSADDKAALQKHVAEAVAPAAKE